MADPKCKLSVVLVDDSRSVLAQVAALIDEIDGVDVVGTAEDGAKAIQVVQRTQPDLVLLDIVMPVMDGLSALRLMRSRDPALRVAVLSSVGGGASRAEEAFRLGAIQVLSKPIDTDQLADLFERERSGSDEGGAVA